MGKSSKGKSLKDTISSGEDQSWTFENVIAWAKSLKSDCDPGQKGKAIYSDTNFQIIGQIIEKLSGLCR